MSRRPRANAAGVSLFPFLDVLVCTMGSLILLLLVATSRIRSAAVEKARQAAIQAKHEREENRVETPQLEAVPPVEHAPEVDLTAEWKTRIEQLREERDQLQMRLTRSNERLASLQSAALKNKVQAASTNSRLQEIRQQQEQSKQEQARIQAEIVAIRSDLTDAEQRLTKAVDRHSKSSSKFAFLPFDGRTGTTKRPILIECTQDRIRFLPEEVSLSLSELNGFTTDFNPLLIASRELVHFWKAYDRVYGTDGHKDDTDQFESDLVALGDKSREPYVLLLVRPSGVMSFDAAKACLSQLKVAHGYELVPEELEVDSSNPDPDARRICQAAVDQVLAERENFLQLLARNHDLKRDQLQLDPPSRLSGGSASQGSPDDSSFGAQRRNAVARSVSESPTLDDSSTPVAARSTATSQRIAAPRSAGNDLGANTPSFANSRSGKANHGSQIERYSNASDQEIANSNQRIAQQKRSLNSNEPDEEPLPQSANRRFENDDTKPFPLGRSGRTNASDSGSTSTANQANSQDDARRSASRSSGNPRTTSSGSSSSNMVKMKRRYQMPQAGIGLEKAIPIRIWSNRVLVAEEFEIPIDSGVRTESLIDRVLMGLDRVQAHWPNAGDGYHWVPTIKYEVVPGGEQVHQRMTSALTDLGLVSHVEYLDVDPDAAVKPASSREPSRSRTSKPAVGGAK